MRLKHFWLKISYSFWFHWGSLPLFAHEKSTHKKSPHRILISFSRCSGFSHRQTSDNNTLCLVSRHGNDIIFSLYFYSWLMRNIIHGKIHWQMVNMNFWWKQNRKKKPKKNITKSLEDAMQTNNNNNKKYALSFELKHEIGWKKKKTLTDHQIKMKMKMEKWS